MATQHAPAVKSGQIYQIGSHRLMCGDATNKVDVARLFASNKPTLVVTSPPYAKQRDYDRPIDCWDSMMLGAFDGHNFADNVQLLINLGPYHKNNEVVFYWNTWLDMMRKRFWRIYSQYVWDKRTPVAGHFSGRLRPSNEFVFHINKTSVDANKWQPCLNPGLMKKENQGIKDKKGIPRKRAGVAVGSHKVPGSVIQHLPVLVNEAVGVPAQMPKGFAAFLIQTWAKKKDCIVYDPFCGSGTTLLACEEEGVTGLGMEISEQYCAIAIARWNKMHPDKMATLLTHP